MHISCILLMYGFQESAPPQPPHFFVGVSTLDRVESCDHNHHKSFPLVILSDNTIVYYRVVNWTDCH